MKKITYLGPVGATFSELAYVRLAELFDARSLDMGEIVLAKNNQEILPLVCDHGGYGAIAMETEAQGRVEGSVTPFIQLLGSLKYLPITVIGAIRMPISFVLMARFGVRKNEIQKIIAHPKALGACKKVVSFFTSNNLSKVVESSSNGLAAEHIVANSEATIAALGPRMAAEKYGLNVVQEACEDKPATTTFFLLGPKNHPAQEGSSKRAVLVFRLKNAEHYGTLVDVLLPFRDAGLSLRQIHSFFTEEGQYDFFIEIECSEQELELLLAVKKAKRFMDRHILFGPFPVVTG